MKAVVVGLIALAVLAAYFAPISKKETPEFASKLENIAKEINSMDTTWTAEVNKRYYETSVEKIRNSMGTFLEGSPVTLETLEVEEANDIPENFDPRVNWPQCDSIKEIRDQANCGSCWAFGAASAMSDRICIASGQKVQTRISSEDLLSCCRSCGFGCQGGYPSAAWSYAVSTGLVTGGNHGDKNGCRPYSFPNCDHHCTGRYGPCPAIGPTPACKKECQSGYPTPYAQDIKKFSRSYGVSSKESQIQTELMTNGPVEAAFSVYEDFLTYKSGVYQHKTGSYLGGHAVKLLGWGVENGVKYWLVANSWNEDWGAEGLFKILRGVNHCGFEGGLVAGTPKL